MSVKASIQQGNTLPPSDPPLHVLPGEEVLHLTVRPDPSNNRFDFISFKNETQITLRTFALTGALSKLGNKLVRSFLHLT